MEDQKGRQAATTKKINLAIDGENVAWVEFAAALRNVSMVRYINEAIARDREACPDGVRAAYEAFVAARDA